MTPQILSALLNERNSTNCEIAASFAALSARDSGYSVSLSNLTGYIVMSWTAPTVGNYDYVALYAPGADTTVYNGYATFQWCSKGSPVTSNQYSNPGLIAVYWSWDTSQKPKKYVALAQSAPSC